MVVQMDLFASLFEEATAKESPTSPVSYYKAGGNILVWLREISKNVVTPAYILRRLAASSDAELRMAVADHINTPAEVLLVLTEDEDPDVRFALAENHNMSRDVLNKLSNDSNPYVAQRAEKTLLRLRRDDSFRLNWSLCHSA